MRHILLLSSYCLFAFSSIHLPRVAWYDYSTTATMGSQLQKNTQKCVKWAIIMVIMDHYHALLYGMQIMHAWYVWQKV